MTKHLRAYCHEHDPAGLCDVGEFRVCWDDPANQRPTSARVVVDPDSEVPELPCWSCQSGTGDCQ